MVLVSCVCPGGQGHKALAGKDGEDGILCTWGIAVLVVCAKRAWLCRLVMPCHVAADASAFLWHGGDWYLYTELDQ